MAQADVLKQQKERDKERKRQANPIASVQPIATRISNTRANAPSPLDFGRSLARSSVLNPTIARDAGKAVKTVFSEDLPAIGRGVLDVARAAPRSVVSVGLDLVSNNPRPYQPRGIVPRVLFGDRPVQPVTRQVTRTAQDIQPFIAPRNTAGGQAGALAAAVPLAVGATVSDLIPGFGAGRKAATNAAGDVLSQAARQSVRKTPLEIIQQTPTASLTQEPIDVLGNMTRPARSRSVLPTVPQVDLEKVVAERISAREAARASQLPKKSIGQKVEAAAMNLKAKMLDRISPVIDIYNKKANAGELPRSYANDIEFALDDVVRSDNMGAAFLKQSDFSKALQEVRTLGPRALDELDTFMQARQTIDVLNDRNPGIDLASPEAVAAYKKLFGPQANLQQDIAIVQQAGQTLTPYADRVTAYSNQLLDKMVEFNLIAQKTADELKVKFPNYVPLKRIFSEDEIDAARVGANARALASVKDQDIVRRLEGSDRTIESPLESLLSRTQQIFKTGTRNRAANVMADLKDDIPEFGIEKIYTIDDLGKESPTALLADFKATQAERGKDVFYRMKDGVTEIYAIDKVFADVLKNVGAGTRDGLVAFLARLNNMRKVNITGRSVDFIFSNVLRDKQSQILRTNGSFLQAMNPYNFFKAASEVALQRGKNINQAALDGALTISADFFRNPPKVNLDAIVAERSLPSKFLYVARNPKDFLRQVEDFVGRSEQLPRLEEYNNVYRNAIARGKTAQEARYEATKSARDVTTNFLRSGEWGKSVDAIMMFFNASLQSSRALARSFKERPVQTASRFLMTTAAPVVAITNYNMSDPDRRALYEKIRDYEKMTNMIIILPGAYYDETDKRVKGIVKIPSFLTVLAAPFRKATESLYNNDPVGAKDIVEAVIGTFSPFNISLEGGEETMRSVLNETLGGIPGISSVLERYFNEDLFTGAPRIPKNLLDLPKEQQVRPDTSFIARKAGGLLNMSPIEVENVIYDIGGPFGQNVLNVADRGLAAVGIAPEGQVGGRSIGEGIGRRLTSASAGQMEDEAVSRLEAITEQKATSNAQRRIRAEEIDAMLVAAPDAEARRAIIAEQIGSDEALKELVENAKKKRERGWSYDEVIIDRLAQGDGTQAQAIIGEIEARYPNDPTAAYAYVRQLAEREVITETGLAILIDRMLLAAADAEERKAITAELIGDNLKLEGAVRKAKTAREKETN